MNIEEQFGNDYYGNLVIEKYPHLEQIFVKKNSLQNLNSLKICNCETLKNIEITEYELCNNVCSYVKIIKIDSK